MAIPSEYSYLLDDWDFKWAGTDTYVYESGYKLWYNAGWANNPVDIANTSFAKFNNNFPEDFGQCNITPIEPLTINITDPGNNSNVTVAYSNLRYFWAPNANPTYPNNYVRYVTPGSVNTSNQRLVASNYDWAYNYALSFQTSFSDLNTCISYLHSNFRHATIIYNGEQWVPGVPIVYDWQSVESISGKGVTVSLSQIASASINDGESVTGADASAFDVLNDASDVNEMIGEVVQDESKVTVRYSIPSASYEYIKLVYKQGSLPLSYDDGTAINIDSTKVKQEITGIADGKKYYFVIFTDKTTSSEYVFTTTHVWSGEEVDLMYSGENNRLTVQIDNGSILFKMYAGASEIYNFTSPIGSTVDDANNIYVQFIIDEENEVAKPSFIYYNGTSYSINQEEPTDAEMGLIYTWISAGI